MKKEKTNLFKILITNGIITTVLSQIQTMLIIMLAMEITPVIGCRVQCSFCPQSLLMDRYQDENNLEKITFAKPVMMSFSTFKTCIDKLPSDVLIRFSGFSEPWLNPECTRMLLYAFEKGHSIKVFSTLVGMTVKDVELFKHVPFTHFRIHLPDSQLYAKIAINKNYLQVLDKIISSDIPNLICMTMGDLPPKIQQIVGVKNPRPKMQDRAGNNETGERTTKKYGPLLCGRAFKNGVNTLDDNVLLPNGDVCLCCQDYGMDHVIGNLVSSDYSSLFQSKEFQNVLDKMSKHDSDIMCRVCKYSIPTKKTSIIKYSIRKKINENSRLSRIYSKLIKKNIPKKNIFLD